jgi:hypothetical protein
MATLPGDERSSPAYTMPDRSRWMTPVTSNVPRRVPIGKGVALWT